MCPGESVTKCPGCKHIIVYTVKPPIEDTLKEDKPPNKGQAKTTFIYRKSRLKEDNLYKGQNG